ncbi:pilus assembly protein CpaB [Nocardioides seonyuensis]|uniref:Pilus assembly protein CpaB n=1 Tax=Nocardioides seonyuensis TaxID=2518371 RepID=A0A4P7IFG3_9ACTN|nr:SAF domain-containing protein [Nocardioides seonyuensis]QBX56014.1 pilus assembly protein CpaB [Nocardioides seonyuensis]
MHSPGGPTSVLRRRLRGLRRRVLRRRRLIAAGLAGAAVLAAMRVASPPTPASVEVPVATRDLPAGVRLADGDVSMRALPAGAAPDRLASDAVGRVLASPVTRGEPLTSVRLVGRSLAEAHPDDAVLPVRLPDAGMAALLRPGDVVDLLATDPGTGAAQVVTTGATVLAVPEGLPEGPAGGHGGGALVVMAVAAHDSLDVTSAALSQFLTVGY